MLNMISLFSLFFIFYLFILFFMFYEVEIIFAQTTDSRPWKMVYVWNAIMKDDILIMCSHSNDFAKNWTTEIERKTEHLEWQRSLALCAR